VVATGSGSTDGQGWLGVYQGGAGGIRGVWVRGIIYMDSFPHRLTGYLGEEG